MIIKWNINFDLHKNVCDKAAIFSIICGQSCGVGTLHGGHTVSFKSFLHGDQKVKQCLICDLFPPIQCEVIAADWP